MLFVSSYKSKLIKRNKQLLALGMDKYIPILSEGSELEVLLTFTKNNIKAYVLEKFVPDHQLKVRSRTLFWTSSAKEKFKSKSKTTSLAVKAIAKSVVGFFDLMQKKDCDLLFIGFNRMSEELTMEISKTLTIKTVEEVSSKPHGGCRLKRTRRV